VKPTCRKDIQIDTTTVTTCRVYELRDEKNDTEFLLHLYYSTYSV